MQLFFSDAVGGRVWWAVHRESALGEGLVYGGPLTTGNTGNCPLRSIRVLWFTGKYKARLAVFYLGATALALTVFPGPLCTQPVVFGDEVTQGVARRSRRGRSQIFSWRNTCGLGSRELQHKLQHVSQRILGRSRAIVFVAVK